MTGAQRDSIRWLGYSISIGGLFAVLLLANFISIPGKGLGFGVVSNEYVKQWVLLWLTIILIGFRTKSVVSLRVLGAGVPVLFLFVGLASLSLLWSASATDSLRYVNKLWLAVALITASTRVPPTQYPRVLKVFMFGVLGFLTLTVVGEIWLRDWLFPIRMGDPRLVGFSDIHSTKFLCAISAILFGSLWLETRRYWIGIVAILSLVLVLLSLQRAVIGATAIALTSVAVMHVGRERRVALIASVIPFGLLFSGLMFLVVFRFEPVRDRMFPNEASAGVAEDLVLSGDIVGASQRVHLRGRERLWQAADEIEPGFLGRGYGAAPRLLEERLGEYWEIHNDLLKLRIELGIPGVVIYAAWVLLLLGRGISLGIGLGGGQPGALVRAGVGVLVLLPLVGLFDNALDHAQKMLVFGIVLLVWGMHWPDALRRNGALFRGEKQRLIVGEVV